jgi:signal transduction histidine kinase
LEHDVLALAQGEHLCLIYEDDPAEQLPALLPYIGRGLENGERCVYVADDLPVEELTPALENHGIDVESEVARGSLRLWTRAEWRQPGELSSERKAAQLRRIVDEALAAGFAGVRFAVEMTWTREPDIDVDRLRHWEAALNTIFTPEIPARIVCQYSRRRFSSQAIQAALSTHPLAALGAEVCANPYYEAPLILAGKPHSRPDGTERVEWMLSQLRWANAREREQRLQAEATLEQVAHSRQQIQELYNRIEAAAVNLQKAVAVKDEFVGLVSHELRTPITVILGNAQVLLKTMTFDAAEHRAALLDIRAEAERLNRIIANLLILAKLEGGHRPEIEPILVTPILERVIAEQRRRFPDRRVNVRYRSAGTPCLGNAVYVEQVLANLLSNAQKYSPEDAAIDVVLAEEDAWRTVRVLDRGIGIGHDDLEHVFEAFYRSDAASRITAGIGIGLTVCKRLIDAQDGRIWAKPREDGGTEFGFALRLCETPTD